MKRNKLILSLFAIIALAACNNFQAENDQLKEENDSLKNVTLRMEEEVDLYFESMTAISADMERAKALGGYINSQVNSETDSLNQTQSIRDNVKIVENILAKNKAEIESLRKKLNAGGLKIKGMEKAMASMSIEIERMTSRIDSLEAELSRKNIIIAKQKSSIENLQDTVETLTSVNEEKSQEIARQNERLYTAWYVFGTSKELKDQGIISRSSAFSSPKVLQGEFNHDYFVKIDRREVNQIPLYARKAKVLTNHPYDSYILEKQNDQYTLRILDKNAFWSISRYLVIVIN